MVERNLAKVEVASSNLVSRSRILKANLKGRPRLPFFVKVFTKDLVVDCDGAVAKRLCPGLQIRLVRFDSGPRLQNDMRE